MRLSSLFAGNAAGNVPVEVYANTGKAAAGQSAPATQPNADRATLSGLGQLHSALASFQGVVQSLSGKGVNLSAASSAEDVLTASTSNRSVAGSYAITVTQLAQSQVLKSQSQASPDAVIGQDGESALHFDFGSTSGHTFATSPSMSGATVILPRGSNHLQGIADAINASKIGVSAQVSAGSSGYALQLTAPSGAANSLRVTVAGDPGLQDLLSYNPIGEKKLTQSVPPQDASLTINGVAFSSSSNSVTGTVPGTTLNLTAKGSTRLEVGQGSVQLGQNVENLVTAYNALNAKLGALAQGELQADGSATQVQHQLAAVVNAAVDGTSGHALGTLANIGMTQQANGDLSIDARQLQHAINVNPAGVATLFTNGGKGIADQLLSQIQGLVESGMAPAKTAPSPQDAPTGLNSPDLALTVQANALVNVYSQQVLQGYATGSALLAKS